MRPRLSRDARMEQVLDVAHRLFAEKGYAAATMDEIAAAVGVTKPLLYTYFGNKERLYVACMERSGDALIEAVTAAVAATTSPTRALAAGVRAFFAFLDSDRAAWAVLFDETLPIHGEVAEHVGAYRARILRFVAGSIRAQLPEDRRRAAEPEIEALSSAVLGAAEALARWWLRTEALDAGQAAELLIATIEPGLRARSGGLSTSSDPPPKGPRTR
ncbi:MAG: TetR/AcrR family transcriptional regulator [Solirubrobacterales bacterium]